MIDKVKKRLSDIQEFRKGSLLRSQDLQEALNKELAAIRQFEGAIAAYEEVLKMMSAEKSE